MVQNYKLLRSELMRLGKISDLWVKFKKKKLLSDDMYEKAMLWAFDWNKMLRKRIKNLFWERERERKSRWEDVYSTALQKKVWGEKSEVKGALIRFDGKRVWPGKCHESGNGINDCMMKVEMESMIVY